ncbi:hypothetical protein EOK75_16725 (plasmid) [Pseudorhodobacter turbinis]|uniref:Uncharacterized protein n=1 Tax=Pseudorhodobacter turbinis TaxID=2500533 RepID=A0A4P8EK07_9RHOB|nr:hypothetical protein [Pseudorhodobacter turbinis]QCO57367.1 hypothetical protein EOK75_16725 [Pseudorhodobacter turbinis]
MPGVPLFNATYADRKFAFRRWPFGTTVNRNATTAVAIDCADGKRRRTTSMEEENGAANHIDRRPPYDSERVMLASKDWVEGGYQAINARNTTVPSSPKERKWAQWASIAAALIWSAVVVGVVEWGKLFKIIQSQTPNIFQKWWVIRDLNP